MHRAKSSRASARPSERSFRLGDFIYHAQFGVEDPADANAKGRGQRITIKDAAGTALVVVGGLLLVRLLKMLVAHPRPNAGADDTPVQWLGLTWNAAYNSFPSGHSADIATSAFCLCLLLARPWQRAYVLGFAALIGLTRILLAKHWASDVLAGSAVGLVVSALIAGFWLRRLAGDAAAA